MSTIRKAVRSSIVPLAVAAVAALSLSACQEARSGTPPAAEMIDQAGIRTQFDQPRQIDFPSLATSRPIKSLLNVPQKMSYGQFAWNTEGVPAGPLWILVDLEAQTMSVFRGQHEIATTVLLFGMDQKPTPVGRFVVRVKSKDYWSRTYDAPMPYSLMLTDDGVAIHGSEVEPGSATHGCLGVPIDFAQKLFSIARVGDEVMVTRSLRQATS